jgi:hypothetical protein
MFALYQGRQLIVRENKGGRQNVEFVYFLKLFVAQWKIVAVQGSAAEARSLIKPLKQGGLASTFLAKDYREPC